MNNVPKITLIDALGLPVSPEAVWESIEHTFTAGAKSVSEAIDETVKETSAAITGQRFDINGSLTGFKEQKAKTPDLMQKEVDELRREGEFLRTTKEDLGKVAMEKGLAESLKAKRIEVNTVIKGIGNVLYENTVKDDGTLREDVAVEYEKKNSELLVEQLKVNRQDQIALATGAKRNFMGENELLLGGENKQHFTNNPG